MDEFKGADPHDYAIGQKSPEEIGYPFLRGGQAMSPEATKFDESNISDFEERNGLPYIAVRLGYGDNFRADPQVEMKVRAVDEHIRQTMREKGMQDSPLSYQKVLAQMGGKLAESFESSKNHNNMKGLLNSLFMQVSLANRMSSKTYLAEYSKKHTENKIDSSLRALGKALKILTKTL